MSDDIFRKRLYGDEFTKWFYGIAKESLDPNLASDAFILRKIESGDIKRMFDRLLKMMQTDTPEIIYNMHSGDVYSLDGDNMSLVCIDELKRAKEAESLQSLLSPTEVEPDISTLKKQIKHAKSHLERISLEKKLNEAYKKRKRKKNDSRG